MKKIMVTGGAGFVGSHLVERLLKDGNKVLVIDDLSVGKRKYLPKRHKNLTFVRASILDERIEKYFKDVQLVFHLAALTRPQESILDPIGTTRVNVEGIVRVLAYSSKNPVKRVIYASTTSTYGTQKKLPIPETAKPNPMSPYALTKLSGEQYCQLFRSIYGLEYNIIRPFNIYGPRQSVKGGYAAAVPTFIRLLNENKTPWITGDGTQARDFIHVDDVVDLLIRMSQSKIYGEIFNAGYGQNISINKLYETISMLMNKNIRPSYIAPVFEPRETLGDITKAKRLLGWEPKVDLEEGLRRTIKWYRERASIYLQYAGGNSLPHEEQDRNHGWAEFFKSQCLVEDAKGTDRNMVTMKTSEISPTGVMVVQTERPGTPPIKNIGDLNIKSTISHLKVVSEVMQSLEKMLPNDKVRLWHINNSAKIPTEVPADLSKPKINAPISTSQKIAVLHSHCDSMSGNSFIQVNSVRELRKQHASHVGTKQYADVVNTFVEERKRNMKPHAFQRIVKHTWDKQLSKVLTKKYPTIFQVVSKESRSQADLPLPRLSLQLRGGWDILRDTDFSEALLFTHNFLASQWQGIIDVLSKSDKTDLKILHENYNYTVGVVQWNNGNLIFFIDPTVDVAGGVQSTNIHSVRESRELSENEKIERETFRTTLTKKLLSSGSNYRLGKEGEYLLSTRG